MTIRKALIAIAAVAGIAALYGGTARAATTPALRHDVLAQTSSNWAGYAVTPVDTTTTYTSVAGSWTQPAAKCTRNAAATYSAFWLGLGGFADGSQALEQTGTEADCSARGVASYSVWYELVPAAPVTVRLTVKPGDLITASVAVSGQNVTVNIANTTRGTSFTSTLAMTSVAPDTSSAEWIAEAPSNCGNGGCRPLPLTNFGTATFSASSATTADGHVGAISDPAWAQTAVTLQGTPASRSLRGRFAAAVPVADAVPAALSPDGTSFAVAWQQSALAPSGGYGGYGGWR
jgi:hypothetical protein